MSNSQFIKERSYYKPNVRIIQLSTEVRFLKSDDDPSFWDIEGTEEEDMN